MRESGYYPPGAEFDTDAPYNQSDLEARDFDVTVSQTLSKNTTVYTNDYIPGGIYQEAEWDGDEMCTVTCQDPDDTSETDWVEAYKNDSKTPLELIALLKDIIEGRVDINKLTTCEKKSIVEDCSGWVEDELIICEN